VGERNTLLVEDHLGVDRALPASKSYCVWELVTVEACMADHLAYPQRHCDAYLRRVRSFVGAVRVDGREAWEDEG